MTTYQPELGGDKLIKLCLDAYCPGFYELIAQRKTQIDQFWMHSQWLFITVLILHEVIPEKARVVVICLSLYLYAAWVVLARPVFFRYLVIYTQ